VISLKIHTIGGYEKVGGNMTAVEVDRKIVILDMGADVERLVEGKKSIDGMDRKDAIKAGIVPDDSVIERRSRDVLAIVVGHGHHDHCRGVPKLARAYDCPVLATPFTASIIERVIRKDEGNVENDLIRIEPGETYQISKSFELEFIPITHSIPQSAVAVLRTSEGVVVYSPDFKLDEEPTLEDPVDYEKLEGLGEEGVKVYMVDCTRIDESGEARTEAEAKEELEDVLTEPCEEGRGVLLTTFSSHIARLKNIVEVNDGRRKVRMLGRSLKEYVGDADDLGLIDSSDFRALGHPTDIERILTKASEEKSEYLLVATGSQGEPNAVLPKIAEGDYPYSIDEEDLVVFSSDTIPTRINEMNRKTLEISLRRKGASIETEVHSHGHAKREDHRKMMQILQPEVVVPSHGGKEKLSSCARLARSEGAESVRISDNGKNIKIR